MNLEMTFSSICMEGKWYWKGARDLIDPFWSPKVNFVLPLKHETCWPFPYMGQFNVLFKETISRGCMGPSTLPYVRPLGLMIHEDTDLPLIFLCSPSKLYNNRPWTNHLNIDCNLRRRNMATTDTWVFLIDFSQEH